MKLKLLLGSLILGALALAFPVHASFGPLLTTSDSVAIQNEINQIQQEINALQKPLGIVVNPPIVTSSTLPGDVPFTDANNTFTGANMFNATTTFNNGFIEYGPSFITGTVNAVYYFPTPAQLTAGATCGTTTGVTEVGTCFNDIYAAGSLVASTTQINVGTYQYTNWTVPVNFNQKAQLVYVVGAGGNGASLTYQNTTGTAITVNDCDSSPSKRQVTQLSDLGIYGTSATSTGGGLTLIYAGGTNGACATNFNDLTLRTATYGLQTGSNTYMFSLSNSIIASMERALWQNSPSNSGESMEYINDKFVDPALSTSGGIASSSNYVYLDTNSSPSTNFIGGSIDNGQIYIGGGNFEVNFYGVHIENPSAPSLYPTYDFVYATSSGSTNVNFFGGTFTQDVTSTQSGGPIPEFLTYGGNMAFYGTAFDRNGSATGTTRFANYLTGSNADITVSNVQQISTPWGGNGIGGTPLPLTQGTFTSDSNSYMVGCTVTAGNALQCYHGGGVYSTVAIVGSGSNTTGAFTGLGGTQNPSSTVDDFGSLGLFNRSSVASQTLSEAGTGSNLAWSYTLTGTVNATYTLPAANSVQNRVMEFGNISKTAGVQMTIQTATSTDFIQIRGVTTTSMTLNDGDSVTIQDQGGTYYPVSPVIQTITTGAIGGSSLATSTCVATTTAIDSWVPITAGFTVTPGVNLNPAFFTWSAQRTAAGTITTSVCDDTGNLAETPTSTAYTVKITD